jgi:hypothetical protein
MRLLLLKQDEMSVLEERLDELDEKEDRELFLGSIRRDINSERRQLVQDLQGRLEEYGTRGTIQNFG